jgi:hypothetical protein
MCPFGFGKPNFEKMKANKDIKGLEKELKFNKDPLIRATAAVTLGQIGDVGAWDGLNAALKDSDETVRNNVKCALVVLDRIKKKARLKEEKASEEARLAEIVAMRDQNPKYVDGLTDRLTTALRDPRAKVRTEAAIGLAEMNPAYSVEAVSSLIVALKDSESNVRANAAKALGRIGEDKSVDSQYIVDRLSFTLNDSVSEVSTSAKVALDKIVNREENAKSLAASITSSSVKEVASYQRIEGNLLTCSKCGTTIEFIGEFGGIFSPSASVRGYGSSSDYDMWKSNVCTKCGLVFCGNCIKIGHPTPCPDCRQPTEPTYRGTIKHMNIRKPYTKNSDRKTSLEGRYTSDDEWERMKRA